MIEQQVEINDQTEEHTVGGKNTFTTTTTTSNTSTTTSNTSTAPKEKRNWLSSLTRKKSHSSTTLANNNNQNSNNNNNNNNNSNNNNNEISTTTDTNRKRKDERNLFHKCLFQKFFSKKKIGLRFPILHLPFDNNDDDYGEQLETNGTTDASAEFVTHSPARKPLLTFSFMQSNNNNNNQIFKIDTIDEPEFIPFTHNYRRFIVKKWLDTDAAPIMYKACCEMLSQVWYWGEISRRDSQKKLTDKPTGSFLVRDSESKGCQFTLSFRIVNVTLHYRLEYRDSYWHFEELQYESIVEMIEDILHRCTNDNFVCFVKVPNEVQPPFPVILKYPLSRYARMPDLQDLCRRFIQCHFEPNEIIKLPLPPKLLEYLGEPRELVFQS